MIFKIKRSLVLIGLLLLPNTIFLFAVYGGIQFSLRSERSGMARLVESQQAKIINLELKVRELRRINSLIPILEQVLTGRTLTELELISEQIRQQKYKNYEAIEQPILNEKELKKLKR